MIHLRHAKRILICGIFFIGMVDSMVPQLAHAVLGINIRNVSLGGGINAAWKPTDYPEVPAYKEPGIKKSFIIDFRLDIPVRTWLRFVPDFSYCSWGSFPRQGTQGAESILQIYDINFDYQTLFRRNGRVQPYIGFGLGFHVVRHVTQFPYSMFERSPIVVAEISERSLKIGPNISIGNDFYIVPGMALFQELRWEFVFGFHQVRFIIGLNTF